MRSTCTEATAPHANDNNKKSNDACPRIPVVIRAVSSCGGEKMLKRAYHSRSHADGSWRVVTASKVLGLCSRSCTRRHAGHACAHATGSHQFTPWRWSSGYRPLESVDESAGRWAQDQRKCGVLRVANRNPIVGEAACSAALRVGVLGVNIGHA